MSYDYGNSNLDGIEAALFAGIGFLGVLLLFALVLSLAIYIFQSIGLYTIAKRRGIRYPGLAWVPVANIWIIGSLADHYMNVTELKETKSRYILLCLEIVTVVITILTESFTVISSLKTILGILNEQYDAVKGYVMTFFGTLGFTAVLLILAIVLSVFEYIALYRIFKSCQPSNAVLYLLLSIFVSVSMPFILFAIRNKDEGMIPAYVNPPYGEE